MTTPHGLSEREIHAHVERLLPETELARLESLIAANPEAQALAQTYRAQNQGLHALFDGALAEPRPAPMDVILIKPRLSMFALLRRIAAALASVVLGGVAGWTLRGAGPPPAQANFADAFVRYAAYAHLVYLPEVRHPVEVVASEEAHLVAWLSKRLGQPLAAPKLGELGYNLVGGRLLPSGKGPAAQFMYENDRGERLTVYVRASDPRGTGETAFRFARQDGVSMFYWMDQSLAYAVSGDVERDKLLHVARAAYQTLSP